MVKNQHLEGCLSKSLKEYSEQKKLYYMKLQVNPLAHCVTPGDYMVLTDYENILIECKETKSDRYDFNRLTQEKDLIDFHTALERNTSFILICFWKGSIKKSHIYLLNIREYMVLKAYCKEKLNKKSVNLKDLQGLLYYDNMQVEALKGSILRVSEFF